MNDLSFFVKKPPVEAMPEQKLLLYRAYMKGAYDAMHRQAEEQDDSLIMTLAAMGFGFLCWAAMMFFVFRR